MILLQKSEAYDDVIEKVTERDLFFRKRRNCIEKLSVAPDLKPLVAVQIIIECWAQF